MSDDLARDDREVRRERREEKRQKAQEVQEQLRLALKEAPQKFEDIRERMQRDIQTYCEDPTFQSLELQVLSDMEFTIKHRPSPRVELNVLLDGTAIRCKYMFSPKESAEENKDKCKRETLRIRVDVGDPKEIVAVYKNGGDESFANDSEISVYLLQFVLDYIEG